MCARYKGQTHLVNVRTSIILVIWRRLESLILEWWKGALGSTRARSWGGGMLYVYELDQTVPQASDEEAYSRQTSYARAERKS